MGYHLRLIRKAPAGSLGKVREELEEFADACEQGVRLMALQELSDLYGATHLYLAEQGDTAPAETLALLLEESAHSGPLRLEALLSTSRWLEEDPTRTASEVSRVFGTLLAFSHQYLSEHAPCVRISDLAEMAAVTARAFRSGRRT